MSTGLLGMFIFAILLSTKTVFAAQDNKVYWCHCEPNGNCQTLHLPLQALQNAGHVNANGNPLHAGDHAGACVEVAPTVKPTDTPTPTIPQPTEVIPSPTINPCDGDCVTPTPTEEITPEPTRPVEPTVTPELTGEPLTPANAPTTAQGTPECTDRKPDTIAWATYIPTDTKGEQKIQWANEIGAETVNIRYRLDGEDWKYGAVGLPNTGNYIVKSLKSGKSYWYQIAGVHGCAAGDWSKEFDPIVK